MNLSDQNYDIVNSAERRNSRGDLVEVTVGYDERRFRSPELEIAQLNVVQEDGTEHREEVQGHNVVYDVRAPTDEVKLDINEADSNARPTIKGVTGWNYMVSPIEISSDRIHAEIREPEYGILQAEYTSEEVNGQPFMELSGWNHKSRSKDTLGKTSELLNYYNFDSESVINQLKP